MGGWFAKREKNLKTLIFLSEGSLNATLVEEIIMRTYFNEEELIKLYIMFKKLVPNRKQLIKTSSFFKLPFLEYCAFKDYLPRAFNIVIDNNNFINDKDSDSESESNNDENKNNVNYDKLYKNNNDDDVIYNNLYSNKEFMSGKKLKQKATVSNNLLLSENKSNKNTSNANLHVFENDFNRLGNNNFINDVDKKFESSKEKFVINPNTATDFVPNNSYRMNFRTFCNYLKVFNPKYPVDFKIKFYFKIFDVDGDGFISKDDLRKYIYSVIPSKEEDDEELEEIKNEEETKKEKSKNKDNDSQNKEEENIPENHNKKELSEDEVDVEKIISILFKEVLGYENRASIEYEEFQKLMWITNIDTSCVIHL